MGLPEAIIKTALLPVEVVRDVGAVISGDEVDNTIDAIEDVFEEIEDFFGF